MKDIVKVDRTTYDEYESFLSAISQTGQTTFGGWKNTIFYALEVAFSKYGNKVELIKNEFGYMFAGLPKKIDIRSQEPDQLMNRFVMAGLMALETNDPEYVFQFSESWALYKVRHKTSSKNSTKAKRERKKKSTTEIIRAMASSKDTAQELWNRFIGEIDLLAEKVEDGKIIALYLDDDGHEDKITFTRFSDRISEERGKNPV